MDGLLPLIVGVVGHRAPRDDTRAAVVQGFGDLLAALQRELPSTPLLLVTPAREGAEQIAAQAFIERTGGTVIVPASASASLGNPSDRIRSIDEDGDALMQRIVESAHVFVALWDGSDDRDADDVACAVGRRLRGVVAEEADESRVLDPPETGSVYHIVTPTADGPAVADAGTLRVLEPEGGDTDDGEASDGDEMSFEPLEQVEVFNADAVRRREELQTLITRSRGWLLPTAAIASLKPEARDIVETFVTADALALFNQRRATSAMRLLLVITVTAVLASQIYGLFLSTPVGAGLCMLTIVAAVATLSLASRNGWHRKYLNYRAVAEALRVQLFWHIAGVEATVSDSYLRVQRSELQGIRRALRCGDLPMHGAGRAHVDDPLAALRLAVDHWLANQRQYFVGRPGDPERRGVWGRLSHRIASLERWRRLAVWLGSAAVLGVFTLHALVPQAQILWSWREAPQDARAIVIMVGEVLLSIGAALATYEAIQGYPEQRRTARKLGELFARAEARVRAALDRNDVDQARRVLESIGREALAENADWLVLHRDRPMEFEPS